MPIAYLDWSLYVECPKCKETTDLSKNDDDAIVSRAIFHNIWDELNGYEVTCEACGHEFKVDEVEY